MTTGESPILARSPATGLSGVVKLAGEAAFTLPQLRRTILAKARTSGREDAEGVYHAATGLELDIGRSPARGPGLRQDCSSELR